MSDLSPSTIDTRAQAVAEVQQLHADFASAMDEIAQLKADLHREQDRVVLLTDERNRLRKEAFIYRDHLVTLATAQANVNLLTAKSAEILTTVHELLDRVDGHETTSEEKKAAVAASLAAIDSAIAGTGQAPVAEMSERA